MKKTNYVISRLVVFGLFFLTLASCTKEDENAPIVNFDAPDLACNVKSIFDKTEGYYNIAFKYEYDTNRLLTRMSTFEDYLSGFITFSYDLNNYVVYRRNMEGVVTDIYKYATPNEMYAVCGVLSDIFSKDKVSIPTSSDDNVEILINTDTQLKYTNTQFPDTTIGGTIGIKITTYNYTFNKYQYVTSEIFTYTDDVSSATYSRTIVYEYY